MFAHELILKSFLRAFAGLFSFVISNFQISGRSKEAQRHFLLNICSKQ